MSRFTLSIVCVAVCSALSTVAFSSTESPVEAGSAYGLLVTSIPLFVSSGSLDKSSETSGELSQGDDNLEHKLAMAQDEAAAFVASVGGIRGVQLEAALEALRKRPGLSGHDDQSLAQAILARQGAGGR